MEVSWGWRTTMRELVVPVFALYCIAAASFAQTTIPQDAKILLLLKLLLGAAALGAYPYWRMRRAGFAPVLQLPNDAHRVRRIAIAVLFGIFLLYTYLFLRFEVFTGFKYIPLFEYYGHYSMMYWGYIPILVAMTAYVLAEEIFFRGLVYRILKEHLTYTWAVIAAVELFVFAHLNIEPPLVITLTLLSLVTIVFYEKTHTIAYGFITHACLNVGALLLLTDSFGTLIRASVVPVFSVLLLMMGGIAVVTLWPAMMKNSHRAIKIFVLLLGVIVLDILIALVFMR